MTAQIPVVGEYDKADPAFEINQLHEAVQKNRQLCEGQLSTALMAAWQAGKLLCDQKKLVRSKIGPGAWTPWININFRGNIRTAQRYMCLAKNVTDVSFLSGLSLRQTYMILGLSVETKGEYKPILIPPLPVHMVSMSRFLKSLPTPKELLRMNAEKLAVLRQDVRPAFIRLTQIFENR